jgi:hypothetical protein
VSVVKQVIYFGTEGVVFSKVVLNDVPMTFIKYTKKRN